MMTDVNDVSYFDDDSREMRDQKSVVRIRMIIDVVKTLLLPHVLKVVDGGKQGHAHREFFAPPDHLLSWS